MALLEDIKNHTKQDVKDRKVSTPLEQLKEKADTFTKPISLKNSIDEARKKFGFSIIGEIKRKSPSMGDMKIENFKNALDVYNNSPIISGISVLTDLKYFGQGVSFLEKTKKKTQKPILRKDFIVDTYQVWEAKANKADAILLMSTLHRDDSKQFHKLYELARSINLEVLIEFGMEMPPHQDFLPKDAHLIGINSREFNNSTIHYAINKKISSITSKDLSTNRQIHRDFYKKLENLIGDGQTVIAESGIGQASETKELAEIGYSGALIGTAFLKQGNIEKTVSGFSDFVTNCKTLKTNFKYAI
jgi:indole-3-glycerol phosphate synthase